MELFDEGIKLTKEDISKYEKKMNTKFPEAYVSFLLESNGGTPEEDLAFDFIDIASNKKNSTDIREFYIFYPEGESSYDDIIKVNYIMKSEGLVPEECLVFADESEGNPICMKTVGENQESIFLCDHELENANNGYLLMSKVADSFNEFIEKLYIIE